MSRLRLVWRTVLRPLALGGPAGGEDPAWSPYNYVLNNPLGMVDPDGRLVAPPGDYYNQKGKKIGSNDLIDGNIYLVKDGRRNERNVREALKTQNYKEAQDLSILLPNIESRYAMGVAADDTKENQEQGGVGLLLENGSYIDVRVLPGPVAEADAVEATIDLAVNPENVPTLATIAKINKLVLGEDNSPNLFKTAYDYHTHPRASGWEQGPSKIDINRAKEQGDLTLNRYVLSPKLNKVYIYNGEGVISTMPLDVFRTIKSNQK